MDFHFLLSVLLKLVFIIFCESELLVFMKDYALNGLLGWELSLYENYPNISMISLELNFPREWSCWSLYVLECILLLFLS